MCIHEESYFNSNHVKLFDGKVCGKPKGKIKQ